RTAQLVLKASQPYLSRYIRFDTLQFYLVHTRLSRIFFYINARTNWINSLEQIRKFLVLRALVRNRPRLRQPFESTNLVLIKSNGLFPDDLLMAPHLHYM